MSKEKNMTDSDVDKAAAIIGIGLPVRVSPELATLLKPNAFTSGLGIKYAERLTAILGILKGSLVPKNCGPEGVLPPEGIVIPFTIATGPYIREEPVSIIAELTDDGDQQEILLTAILEEE
jgi:hypothetical protein